MAECMLCTAYGNRKGCSSSPGNGAPPLSAIMWRTLSQRSARIHTLHWSTCLTASTRSSRHDTSCGSLRRPCSALRAGGRGRACVRERTGDAGAASPHHGSAQAPHTAVPALIPLRSCCSGRLSPPDATRVPVRLPTHLQVAVSAHRSSSVSARGAISSHTARGSRSSASLGGGAAGLRALEPRFPPAPFPLLLPLLLPPLPRPILVRSECRTAHCARSVLQAAGPVALVRPRSERAGSVSAHERSTRARR